MARKKKADKVEVVEEVAADKVEVVDPDEIVWMDSATGHKRGVEDPDPK